MTAINLAASDRFLAPALHQRGRLAKPPFLLAIKPRHAELIFQGGKRWEYRIREHLPNDLIGRECLVYVSSPAKQLRGGFRIHDLILGQQDAVWSRTNLQAGIDRAEYDAYYACPPGGGGGCQFTPPCAAGHCGECACALHLRNLWEYASPPSLAALREELGGFRPPPSWRELTTAERRLLLNHD